MLPAGWVQGSPLRLVPSDNMPGLGPSGLAADTTRPQGRGPWGKAWPLPQSKGRKTAMATEHRGVTQTGAELPAGLRSASHGIE